MFHSIERKIRIKKRKRKEKRYSSEIFLVIYSIYPFVILISFA